MKRHPAFEKYAKKVIAEYQRKLLLDRHTIDIEPRRTGFMECGFRPPYLDITIGYNPKQIEDHWRRKDLSTLKHSLIHELCHVLTDPFYDKAAERFSGKRDLENERETMVDHIAMIITKNRL